MKEITDKQHRAINFIEEELEIKFDGKDRYEASKFIGEWLERAQFCQRMDRAIGNIGVTMFHSHHDKCLGIDETYIDNKGSIADIKFKGDAIRGRNSVDALIDLQTGAVYQAIKRVRV